MGAAADMILDGILCAECQVFIDDQAEGFDGPDGIPRYCRKCGGLPETNGQRSALPTMRKRRRRKGGQER